MRRSYGVWPACWALLVLSLDSAFIFYAKLDVGPITEKLMWMMLCLWTLSEWGRSRKYPYLFVGLMGAAIGMYSHISFIWFILASSSSLFLLFRKEIRTLPGKRDRFSIGIAAVLLSTFFLYWLIGARDLLRLPILGFSGTLVLLQRLATEAGGIPDILGERFRELIRVRPISDLFFVVSTVFLLSSVRDRAVKFILILMSFLLIQISLTPGAIPAHRVMLLYIFFPMVAGLSIEKSIRSLCSGGDDRIVKWFFSGIVVVLAILSLGGQLLLTKEVTRAIKTSGGTGVWSDEIYHLAEYLKKGKWKKVVCVDWGFRKNLFLLTKGEVLLEEPLWEWEDAQKMEEDLKRMSRGAERGTLFLLHPEVYWVGGYPTVEQFEEIVRQSGATAVRQKTFYEKNGKPVYFVYVIEP